MIYHPLGCFISLFVQPILREATVALDLVDECTLAMLSNVTIPGGTDHRDMWNGMVTRAGAIVVRDVTEVVYAQLLCVP